MARPSRCDSSCRFPPGGTVDPLARLLGTRLTAALGQQFVVDNRTGGSGSIGTAIAAKAAPDGYTYVFVFDTHAVNPSLIPNLPFDTVKDLAPVMLVGTAPNAVVTLPSKPYKTFADVIKAAKAKPDSDHVRIDRQRQPRASHDDARAGRRAASRSGTCRTKAAAR